MLTVDQRNYKDLKKRLKLGRWSVTTGHFDYDTILYYIYKMSLN